MAEADRRGMGRGLSAILPKAEKGEEGLREVPVDLVRPNPRQPRRSFDEGALAELADSIRARSPSSRWMPATPTSYSRCTVFPISSAVTAASSATGRSEVPAATTRIVPLPSETSS